MSAGFPRKKLGYILSWYYLAEMALGRRRHKHPFDHRSSFKPAFIIARASNQPSRRINHFVHSPHKGALGPKITVLWRPFFSMVPRPDRTPTLSKPKPKPQHWLGQSRLPCHTQPGSFLISLASNTCAQPLPATEAQPLHASHNLSHSAWYRVSRAPADISSWSWGVATRGFQVLQILLS